MDLLASVRAGACTPAAAAALQRRCARPLDASDGIQPTKARAPPRMLSDQREPHALRWRRSNHHAPAMLALQAQDTAMMGACAPPPAATLASTCWEACAGRCTCLWPRLVDHGQRGFKHIKVARVQVRDHAAVNLQHSNSFSCTATV